MEEAVRTQGCGSSSVHADPNTRVDLRPQRHRGDQPRRLQLRTSSTSRRGRRECSSRHMEHHANIVPWQQLCEEKGAVLRVITDRRSRSQLEDVDEFDEAAHPPDASSSAVAPRLERARHREPDRGARRDSPMRSGVPLLVDGAQAVPHQRVDVQRTGLRLLRLLRPQALRSFEWRRCPVGASASILEAMPPFLTGGDDDRER